MTPSHVLELIVAFLVCWASLTAIFQSPREAAWCDAPYATSSAPQVPLTVPTQAEAEEIIRDMKRHD